MASNDTKVITRRQAKKQINHFGRSLILYILTLTFLRYGIDYLIDSHEEIFMGYDPEMIRMIASIVLTLLVTLIAFNISSRSLHLNIRDYLKKPELSLFHKLALCSVGIAINLIVTSIATLFYLFFRSEPQTFTYLGYWNTTGRIINNILYLVFFVFVKPICEEYIFRGVIQRQLGHYGRYFGVLGSALLYAIAQTNFADAIGAFFIGWYLSLITLRYHSIRISTLVHVTLLLFLWVIQVIPGNLLWLVTLLIIAAYLMAAVFIFQKQVDTGMIRYGATDGKLWKILLTSSTVIISIALFIVNIVLSIM